MKFNFVVELVFLFYFLFLPLHVRVTHYPMSMGYFFPSDTYANVIYKPNANHIHSKDFRASSFFNMIILLNGTFFFCFLFCLFRTISVFIRKCLHCNWNAPQIEFIVALKTKMPLYAAWSSRKHGMKFVERKIKLNKKWRFYIISLLSGILIIRYCAIIKWMSNSERHECERIKNIKSNCISYKRQRLNWFALNP